jgi:hypothetical protein
MGRINGGAETQIQYPRFTQDLHIIDYDRSPKMPILLLTL